MPEIPNDSSFVKELPYCHIVVIAFVNKEAKLELAVWGYQNPDDAEKRFNRVIKANEEYEKYGVRGPVISAERFMVGLYENFEQSLFGEHGEDSTKIM